MILLFLSQSYASDIYVSPGSSIQEALNNAVAGDSIIISGGEYEAELVTMSGGTEANPILITAAEGEEVILTTSGEVLQIEHP